MSRKFTAKKADLQPPDDDNENVRDFLLFIGRVIEKISPILFAYFLSQL